MNYTLPNPHIDSTLLVRIEIESKGDDVVAVWQYYRDDANGSSYDNTPDGTKEIRYKQRMTDQDKDRKDIAVSGDSSFKVLWQWELVK